MYHFEAPHLKTIQFEAGVLPNRCLSPSEGYIDANFAPKMLPVAIF